MKVARESWWFRNFIEITLVSLIIVVFISSIFFVYAEGATMVGIQLSKSCEASINCPTMEQLVEQYDNTNQYYSGFFDYDNYGYYKRQTSNFKNHWLFYTHPTQFIFAVDPQKDWMRYLDYNIVLEPSHFTYYNRLDKIDNNTRAEFRDRYIDNCVDARIYYELLDDTLSYLLSNCKVTQHQDQVLIYMPPLPVNYSDHKWYAYAEWMKQAMIDCKEKC